MCRGKGQPQAVLIALVALVYVLTGCGGGDEGPGESAHINEATGSTHGIVPDERVGTPPPPAKVTDLAKAADQAGCYLFRYPEPKKDQEIPPGAPAPKYASDPPVAGPHVESPNQQADGAYLVMPDGPDVVAALDHGRVAIQYAPDLTEANQLALKGVFDSSYGGSLFFPNETMKYAIAASAWGHLMSCTSWRGPITLDALRAFGKNAWGKYGHEPVQESSVEGPTPADPEEPSPGA